MFKQLKTKAWHGILHQNIPSDIVKKFLDFLTHR